MRVNIACFLAVCFIPFSALAELKATQFPQTYNDLTFKERLKNKELGYKHFLDKKTYQELQIADGEEYFTDQSIMFELQRQEEELQQQQDAETMTLEEYCKKYPEDTDKCTNDVEDVLAFNQNLGQCQTNWTIGGQPVTPNNNVTGGSCYPPDRVEKPNVLSNKIYTTGKYEHIAPAFEKGMMTVFRKEGHCGKIKGDRGGYTCYGISEASGLSVEQIKAMTRPKAEDYYYDNFWVKYKIGNLPDVISTDYFLAAMGSGPKTAYNQFRKFLNIPGGSKSAQIDSAMIAAVKNYNGDIHKDWINNVRAPFLRQVALNYLKKHGTDIRRGYENAIDIKMKNACHVCPVHPIHR